MTKFAPAKTDSILIEIETAVGLESITAAETAEVFGRAFQPTHTGSGFLRGQYSGVLNALHKLRTAQAVYLTAFHPVPRPKALLGDQHFRRLLGQIEQVQRIQPTPFTMLAIAAAGAETPVMQRLKADLAARLGLAAADDKGDLLVRVLPARQGDGWETLVRLTPRPLATRDWRTHNFEGALNAAVAAALIRLTEPTRDDRYLNLACGSGTLLIERALHGRARQIVGIDQAAAVLALTADHQRAAGEKAAAIRLVQGDLRRLPLPAASFDALTVDLPFGQRVGSHSDNQTLYPAALAEAARVAVSGARLALITHEVKLIAAALDQQTDWHIERQHMITLRGLHPRVYLLRRR